MQWTESVFIDEQMQLQQGVNQEYFLKADRAALEHNKILRAVSIFFLAAEILSSCH